MNVDTYLRNKNENQTGQFVNQRTGDWLHGTNEELNEQKLEAHYMYMSKIQKVLTTDSGPTFDVEPLEKVQIDDEYNVFANEHEHTEQPKNINDIALMENVDSNITPNSLDLCNNDFQDDEYAGDNNDKRVMLANLKLDTDETKKIQKQLRKENITLIHELNECKFDLNESNDIWDRCRSALHQRELELENYKVFKNYQLKKQEVEPKYKETLDLLAKQKHQSNEALEIQSYETF
uniref:Uncharacterized protein n=1 Tax=Tanacetum cinerariifolium TaxID=118510 RepID=A0A6L2NX21_TANCI|nr:hypothetical protein [Tanacetum cinerariifolium]